MFCFVIISVSNQVLAFVFILSVKLRLVAHDNATTTIRQRQTFFRILRFSLVVFSETRQRQYDNSFVVRQKNCCRTDRSRSDRHDKTSRCRTTKPGFSRNFSFFFEKKEKVLTSKCLVKVH